ncbi:MAG TPA: YbhB/YbcL family Raf kinase inhibitor-like protein, partial [Nitrospiraceae bacterium]|nr:YbhB/YbcL family Raf kinase inhibitor-like protein [Nitrospiraceae bacterium]
MAALLLFSPAFGHQQQIPRKYTCDGDDVSPWLRMEQVPPETRSLALIVD